MKEKTKNRRGKTLARTLQSVRERLKDESEEGQKSVGGRRRKTVNS